jgi:hypothetical protein
LLPQIYTPQKIINYASVKKRGRLLEINEKVRCNFARRVRDEEFSKQSAVSNDRPAGSRPAGDRAGRDYYFGNPKEGQRLMASAETVTPAQAINKS